MFNGMKENKTYVTQAPLDGSLGTDQYFLITVSPALYQCFSSVYMCVQQKYFSLLISYPFSIFPLCTQFMNPEH